jgi:Ras-related protein Rab-2A
MPTPSEPTALPWNYISKLVCIGDSGCGKSSLTIRLCEGRFVNSHDVTIGVEFGSRIVPVGPPANAALHINDPSSTSNPSNPSNPSNGSPSAPTASATQWKGKGDREQKKMKVGRCSYYL